MPFCKNKPGHFVNEDSKCVKCSSNCATCYKDKDFCTSCQLGEFINPFTHECGGLETTLFDFDVSNQIPLGFFDWSSYFTSAFFPFNQISSTSAQATAIASASSSGDQESTEYVISTSYPDMPDIDFPDIDPIEIPTFYPDSAIASASASLPNADDITIS